MNKFYTMNQNNSGGYFIINDDVREIVVIEAESPRMAEIFANDITQEYSNYCECCGKRWYTDFEEYDGKEIPCLYGQQITLDLLKKQTFNKSAIIYYLDGRKEIIEA